MGTVKTTLKEKIFYAFGDMGSYICWTFIGSFLTLYLTDCVKLSAANIALMGTIILVCRVFDGLSDIGMGILIEKTNSKLGKARPWFGISIIPLCLVFVLLFSVPEMSQSGTVIYVSILYFLFTVVIYTANKLSFSALLPRISNDAVDQTAISSMDTLFTGVGTLAAAVAIPVLNAFGGTGLSSSWLKLVLPLTVLALVVQALCFFKVKEKPEIVSCGTDKKEKGDIVRGLKALLKCRYFYIALVLFVLTYFYTITSSSMGVYYASEVLGNDNFYAVLNLVPMVTMGIGIILTPILVKQIGKRKTLVIASMCVFLGHLTGALFPYSYYAAVIAVIIKGLGAATAMCQLYTLAPDIVLLIEKEQGLRIEGLAASANSFGSKVGSGLGSAAAMWALAIGKYSAEKATQSPELIRSVIAVYWWIPAVLTGICVVLAAMWNIDEKL